MSKRESEPKTKGRRWAGRVLLWAAAIGLLAWVFRRVDVDQVVAALGHTRPGMFAAVVAAFSFTTLLLDSITHYWVFRRFNPPGDFISTLRSRGETYLLLSLGFLYGQGGMAVAVSRRLKKPLAEIAGSVLFLTFNNIMAMMIFPTLALLLFVDQLTSPEFRAAAEGRIVLRWLIISWPICLAMILFFAKDWDNPIRRRMKKGLTATFDRARLGDYGVAMGLRFLQVILWCGFSWLALLASRIDIPFRELLILGPIIGLAAAIPTPGRLGTSQGAWLLLFQPRVDPAALVAFSLLWTVSVNLLRWLIGAAFLAMPGRIINKDGQDEQDKQDN